MALVFSEMDTGLEEHTLGVELLGRNIVPLHFNTERVAEIVLRAP